MGQYSPLIKIDMQRKKINIINVQEKLKEKNFRLFTVADFQKIFQVNYQAAKRSINRYILSGIVVKAKKGLYFLKNNSPLELELANRIYQPSYISFETALSYYEIIPETIYEITSVTPNSSRSFIMQNLKFSYKKIKRSCFLGYHPEKIKGRTILIADPEKALADYLYFIALKRRELSYERIDLKKIKKNKLIEYAKCFNQKKILEIITQLYD